MIVLPENTFYWGKIHPEPFACVINSSQSKTPISSEQWIINTEKAVLRVKRNSYTLLSSIDINTYELTTFFAVKHKCPLVLIVILPKGIEHREYAEKITHDFDLIPELTGFIFITKQFSTNKPKSLWHFRDQLIIDISKYIFPVSIRPDGFMNKALEINKNEKLIVDDLQIPYDQNKSQIVYDLSPEKLVIKSMNWDYITHWTHTNHMPFQNENKKAFYEDILKSRNEYPRSANMNLLRIIFDRTIYATSDNFRDNITGVSFTELPPEKAVELMQWNSRYVRFYIEPYGLAIKRNVAENLGIRPVIYGKSETYQALHNNEKPFFQAVGKKAEWNREKEWRFIGNLNLDKIDTDAIKIICYKKSEIPHFSRFCNWNVISIT